MATLRATLARQEATGPGPGGGGRRLQSRQGQDGHSLGALSQYL